MEKRNVKQNPLPVFLFADEAHNFSHEYDSLYQVTARSSRIATVYISQNLANFHANMGGSKSEHKVGSFLNTLTTKIFHCNSDMQTNRFASELIGDGYTKDESQSTTVAGTFSSSQSESFRLERMVRPEQFLNLKTGGKENDFIAQAYMHLQNKPFHDGWHHRKVAFKQTL
jgi:type IV secretory pathway TraG/TraD family ATPase VirD4